MEPQTPTQTKAVLVPALQLMHVQATPPLSFLDSFI